MAEVPGTRRKARSPGGRDPQASWYWWAEARAPGRAVVFDLDGVIADASGRQHFLEGPRRDWDAFFDACDEDALKSEVGRLVELLDERIDVVLLTARPARVREKTVAWLESNALAYDLLVMRPPGDFRDAMVFKRDQVRALNDYGFDLRLALEDDPRIAAMFEEEGVPCLYVYSGYYK